MFYKCLQKRQTDYFTKRQQFRDTIMRLQQMLQGVFEIHKINQVRTRKFIDHALTTHRVRIIFASSTHYLNHVLCASRATVVRTVGTDSGSIFPDRSENNYLLGKKGVKSDLFQIVF